MVSYKSDNFDTIYVYRHKNNQIDLGNFNLKSITEIINILSSQDLVFELSSKNTYVLDSNSPNICPETLTNSLSRKSEVRLDEGIGYLKDIITGKLDFEILETYLDFTTSNKKLYDGSLSTDLFKIERNENSSYNLSLKLASLDENLLVRSSLDTLEDILFTTNPEKIFKNWDILREGQHKFSVTARKKELELINSISGYLTNTDLSLLDTLRFKIYGEFNTDKTAGMNTYTSEQILNDYDKVIRACTYFSFNKVGRSGYRTKLELD
jgi:hypothetical protein